MRDIPARVKVGPFWYDVLLVRRLMHNGEEQAGHINNHDQIIRILDNHPPSGMWETFWHEVLHAVSNTSGANLSEKQVALLATDLAGFMVDNGFVTPRVETAKQLQQRLERAAEVQRERDNVE